MKNTILRAMAAGLVALSTAGPALADHPTREQMPEVKRLAHDLDGRSTELHRLAEASAHHGGRLERQALADLHRLEEAADHFHRQIERGADPAHTEADYVRLNLAFEAVRRSFPNLHAFGQIESTFADVRRLVDALRFFYEARPVVDPAQLLRLAHELGDKARHAREQAERELHHGNFSEQYAIRALRGIEQAADHFHGQIEAPGSDLAHLASDFRRVEMAMARAEWIVPRAHFTAHVRSDFDEARNLFRELQGLLSAAGVEDDHGHW